jgi:hypothetical protein
MANQLQIKKIPTGVELSISKKYRELAAGFSVTTFWYYVRSAIDLMRVETDFNVPGDDVETFVAVMRMYFENNGVYALLEDETKEVTLVINSHTTKYKLDKVLRENGDVVFRPLTPWSLLVNEVTPSCSGN